MSSDLLEFMCFTDAAALECQEMKRRVPGQTSLEGDDVDLHEFAWLRRANLREKLPGQVEVSFFFLFNVSSWVLDRAPPAAEYHRGACCVFLRGSWSRFLPCCTFSFFRATRSATTIICDGLLSLLVSGSEVCKNTVLKFISHPQRSTLCVLDGCWGDRASQFHV